MTNSNVKAPAAQDPTAETSFFRWLWQGILRFDEALNFDPCSDVARRITDLERHIEASKIPNRTSSPLR
jgi:hypothetical protein